MTKQTILILNWRLPWDQKAGGAERVTLQHAMAWSQAGYDIFWLSGAPNGVYERVVRDRIQYIGVGPSALFFCFAWLYRFCCIRKNIDCIVDEVHGFPAWSALWAPKTSKVVLIHELAGSIWDEMYPFPVNKIGKWIESTLFPKVYSNVPLWVDAPSMADELKKYGFCSDCIWVIPCAINRPDSIQTGDQKEKVLTIAVVSRLVAMKGITHAIEVFSKIHMEEAQAQLWIIGGGDSDYIQELQVLIKNRGLQKHVRFWGRVSESKKYQLLARCHFLLHTSIREGFGLTILEAESVGVPSAIFQVTGLQDLVSDGVNGVSVAYAKTDLLAKKILGLKINTKAYTTLCKRARLHESSFRWDTFEKMSLQLIQRTMRSKE